MENVNEIGKADLHIHTSFSGTLIKLEKLLKYVEKYTNLDVIAITDHNDVIGGKTAVDVAKEAKGIVEKKNYRFDVVLGQEILTLDGDVIALFVENKIEDFEPVSGTIKNIYDQDGIVVFPHPWLFRGINKDKIEEILDKNLLKPHAIETRGYVSNFFSKTSFYEKMNSLKWKFSPLAGSDGQHIKMVGKVFTIFDGKNSESLKESILKKQTLAGHIKTPFSEKLSIIKDLIRNVNRDFHKERALYIRKARIRGYHKFKDISETSIKRTWWF